MPLPTFDGTPLADDWARPPTVIVADDEPDLRLVIRHQLERAGRFRIVGETADGAEAIDLAARLSPDVILLDLRMPNMDGWETIPRLVCEAPTSMVVVLSVLPASLEEQRSRALGAFAYVEKSNLDSDLDDRVAELLREFRLALAGEDLVPPIHREPLSHEG